MNIIIQDDFDLDKIVTSGQCFRAKEVKNGLYRFITKENVLYIQATDTHKYYISCDSQSWENVWIPFFSLDIDYKEIRRKATGKHPFIDLAMNEGMGLRILRQDPWEMLISFIISQRKSIPAISKSVNMIADRFGTSIITEYETLCAFPSVLQLSEVPSKELYECSIGYRTPYVLDAIQKVSSGQISLEILKTLNNDQLRQKLMQIRGVGQKVANCVCLFGYGRTSAVPVDVWIKRAINENCNGFNPFDLYGQSAGIMQQYVFFYEKSHQH